MKTKRLTAATLAATAVALTALLLAYPAFSSPAAAATPTSTSNAPTSNVVPTGAPGQGGQGPQALKGGNGLMRFGGPGAGHGQRVNVTDGETFSVTSTSGHYFVVGNPSENGTASGAITFTVTGSLTAGDTLSISGSILIGATTYTISSGTAQMNPSATVVSGQGTTNPTGNFLVRASSHGSFVGSNGQVSLDLSSGTTEYIVFLAGPVTS